MVFQWRQGVMWFPPRRPARLLREDLRSLQLAYDFTSKNSSSPGFQVLPIRRGLNEMIRQKQADYNPLPSGSRQERVADLCRQDKLLRLSR